MVTPQTNRPTVKLVGTDGNVFNIIGLCRRAALSQGWTKQQWIEFLNELTHQPNYDAVLAIIQNTFDVE